MTDTTSQPTRRNLLYGTTALVGVTGLALAAWPLFDQMNPDAGTSAADVVNVDVGAIAPGQTRIAQWHAFPILVFRRSAAALSDLQKPTGVLRDPNSERRQQPGYARNWHRSIDPAIGVLVGVCTYDACKLGGAAEGLSEIPGAFACPCCASYYDAAGRAFRGPAPLNLPVPPHYFADRTTLRIGRNPSGEIFSFDSIEAI